MPEGPEFCFPVLNYDPNSVSQEKCRLLTERSEAEVAHQATPFSQVAAGVRGGLAPRGTVRVINTH
jgi:hypothetical protein